MQAVRDLVQSPTGRPIAGATVTVTYTEGGAAASLYAANEATPIVGNVLTTNANGEYEFYTFNGRYTLTIVATGYGSTTREITLNDPEDYDEVSLKKFGLLIAGSNNTTTIQNALTAAVADKLCLVVPPGTWEATQLTIAGNLRWRGAEPAGCVIKQRASTNAHFVTVAYTVVQNPIIENLTLDGNRLNNSAGDVLHLEDHAEPDATVTYGFAVVLRNAYVQNGAGLCMYVGVNRNMGHCENAEFKRGAIGLVSMDESSDWRFAANTRFGFPLSGSALVIGNGADNVVEGCSLFGAIDAPCVKLTGTTSSPVKLIGSTINFNQREGLLIQGPSGIARAIPHIVQGNWFAENGLEADNTYSHIRCTDVSGVAFGLNSFRYNGSGNKVKYLLETTGAAGYHQWVGNSWDQSTPQYGTAISNTPAYLRSRLEGLTVEGVSYLGASTGDLTSNSLRVPQGTSGGNYVEIQGRASGTGPDISAKGVDSAVALRASSKGAAAVEVWTNGLGSRAARFMPVTSAVNRFDFYPAAAGGDVRIVAAGETNVNVSVEPSGTGVFIVPIASVRDYADDAAAASGGVPVGGEYRTGSIKKIRVS